MPRGGRAVRLGGALAVLAATTVLSGGARAEVPRQPDRSGERIESYDVDIDVLPSGRMHVVERITYFFDTSRHGILRRIPERRRFDGRHDRRYPISDIAVTASEGTPSAVRVSRDGDYRVLRIGDPDRTVVGSHDYVVAYDVDGAVDRFPDHDELYWNAVGTEWDVPVDRASVRVTAAAAFRDATCYAGAAGTRLRCDTAAREGRRATFTEGRLAAREGLTVVLALPPGYAARPGPILARERRNVLGFDYDGGPGAVAGATLLLGLAVLALRLRRGRDSRYAGQVPGLEPLGDGAADEPVERVGPFADRAGPVEWAPPRGMTPALMGLVIEERVRPRHVTATILDLAVRGHLRIEEVAASGPDRDWRLTRLAAPEGDEPAPAERMVLDAFFGGGRTTYLRNLPFGFARDIGHAARRLYWDSVELGWYPVRPDVVANRWRRGGAFLVLAGAVATLVLRAAGGYGLTGLAVAVLGVAAIALRHRMPARTPAGSAALARALGFRRYLATAEAARLREEEREQVLTRLLPYAVVLGLADRWAAAFAAAGLSQRTALPAFPDGVAVDAFTGAIDTWTVSGMLSRPDRPERATSWSSDSSSTSGSSFDSGFSSGSAGGGGGGGGGSSW